MTDANTINAKELLEKQLQLLSERSLGVVEDGELAAISEVMLAISRFLMQITVEQSAEAIAKRLHELQQKSIRDKREGD